MEQTTVAAAPGWFDWLSLVIVPGGLGAATLVLSIVALGLSRTSRRLERERHARESSQAEQAEVLDAVSTIIELGTITFERMHDVASRAASLKARLMVSSAPGATDALRVIEAMHNAPMPLDTPAEVTPIWRWLAEGTFIEVADLMVRNPAGITAVANSMPERIRSWEARADDWARFDAAIAERDRRNDADRGPTDSV